MLQKLRTAGEIRALRNLPPKLQRECRARITPCAGSALISLNQLESQKDLGIAVVTRSEILASFIWGELLRAYEESSRRDAKRYEVFRMSGLPRVGTLVWPATEQRVDEKALFLIESTFWLLGWAVAARQSDNLLEHGQTAATHCFQP